MLGFSILSCCALTQSGAMPDRASIELWINNRLSQQLNVAVTFWTDVYADHSSYSLDNNFENSVALVASSLDNCKMDATYRLSRTNHVTNESAHGGDTIHATYPSTMTERVRLNLQDMQPSLLISKQWNPWPDETCTSAHGCSVPAIAFTATASQIQFEDSKGRLQMEHDDLIPIGNDSEGLRIVRALHDEAVLCGAKDVTTNLY